MRRLELKPQEPVEGGQDTTIEAPLIELPDWALDRRRWSGHRSSCVPRGLRWGVELSPVEGEQVPLGPTALADNSRFARGRLVHALLQHLPELGVENRERAARAFVAARGADLPEAVRSEIVTGLLAVANDAEFAPLFAEGAWPRFRSSLCSAKSRKLSRSAARSTGWPCLAMKLLILDYKTNRPPPSRPEDVAPAYIAQLAAYRFALRRLFPGKCRPGRAVVDGWAQTLWKFHQLCLMTPSVACCNPGPSLDVEGAVS